ncbi:MAG TPA: nucleotidyltransferase family protein, partial [Pseudacidobacterium sp.]|nr:nucleotidyltransferase family protein [Pseudacidobacterium sp.]
MDLETNAIVQCLKVFLSSASETALRDVPARQLDWQAVEEKAKLHSVEPVVARVLLQHGSDLAPQEVLQRCRDRLVRVTAKNLLWLEEWRRLMQTFQKAGVPVLSFKGPALALTAYHNLSLREFHDLDFLVHPRDVAQGRDALLGAGYVLWSPVARETAEGLLLSKNRQLRFTNSDRGTTVDLHWAMLHTMFSFQLDVEQVFHAARIERREEAEFLSLSPEHLLLYLCAHGAKDCWSSLSELCDVAAHMQAQEINWDHCILVAEASGCDSLLKHTLLLCGRVLGIDLPEEVKRHC